MDIDHLLGLLELPSELGKQFHDPGQLPNGNDGSSQILALLGFGCDAASINFEILNFLEQVIPMSCLFRVVGFQQSGPQVLALVTLQSPGRRIETCRQFAERFSGE